MTNKERVLKYIQDFGSISSMEAFTDLGNTRLSASIWLLRHEDGLEIESITETKLNRYGEKTHFSRYYLKGSKFEKEIPQFEGTLEQLDNLCNIKSKGE